MGFLSLVNYLWVFFGISGVVVIVIWMIVMSKALEQVSEDLRNMSPNAVWLCLIPLFGVVWQFLVANAVSEGIAKELLARGMFPKEEKPAYGYGLSGCILISCAIIPYAGVCIAIIGLVMLVIHMIRISEYNAELKRSGRWEVFYQARMAAVRGQMNNQYPQNPFPQYPYSQQFPPQAVQPAMPPSPQYTGYMPPVEDVRYKRKDKPENPFG